MPSLVEIIVVRYFFLPIKTDCLISIRTQGAIVLYPTPMGAITQLWAGTSPETLSMNGKYLIPWAREGNARKETRDISLGEKLWTWLGEQVKDVK